MGADTIAGLPNAALARPKRRRWRRYGLPAVLGLALAVLVLVPIGFMFVGSVLSGGLADPDSHVTLDKLRSVYASAPYAAQAVGSTLAISALVGAHRDRRRASLLAWLVARTDLPAKAADGDLHHRAAVPLALRRRHRLADPRLARRPG